MKYRVTCLTPTLVGDGQRLSPIDYMVWKDQVNVLDQRRIFRLLAKGPRLDGYLSQLKRSERLDFASWGGFAQNFAGRRIPFEHPSMTACWERARAENLFIPTFATSPAGPFLPGSAIKGALRTGAVHAQWTERGMAAVAAQTSGSDPRAIRRAWAAAEDAALGQGGANTMRLISASDSSPVPTTSFRIYLLRVATLVPRGQQFELGWKQEPRGASRRAEDGAPAFAEMADPGAVFEGAWQESEFLASQEIARALKRSKAASRKAIFDAVNGWAAQQLTLHSRYAEWAGLPRLAEYVAALSARLEEIRARDNTCLLCIGWGGGFLSKSGFLDTTDSSFRTILKQSGIYTRAIQSGLPFPKTRRIVFLKNEPATLPGWVSLEIE
jgi:CRISPR-associated protein Csm5